MKHNKKLFAGTVFASLLLGAQAQAGNGELTLIHMGDIHGHLVPRHNLRSDGTGRMEGGLARMYTKIKQIRADEANTLLINTGDTIQGSAEALYTRGQAVVDVLNMFRIDAYASGNWDFLYGTQRYLELFAGAAPKAPWKALAANLYYKTTTEDPTTPYPDKGGQRVLPPYLIKKVGNVRVGILGMTTQRGIAAVGPTATKGFKFTNGKAEAAELVPHLRNVEGVDIVVMISELELALNIRMAETTPGIDVILSADMHEETSKPIVVGPSNTIIVEEGQDGTNLGELELKVVARKVASWEWKQHRIDSSIAADKTVAAKVAAVRAPFVTGPHFVQAVNPINGTRLQRPIDSVVGYTAIGLHRSNFSHEAMPAVVEGSSHDFIADAMRAQAGTDVATIRGFRYGTHVPPGPITMEHLYHFLPIGAAIARADTASGQQLKNQIENSTQGVFSTNPDEWTGGWMFGYSGMTFDFDVWAPQGSRGSNIKVNGAPLDLTRRYSVAGYWYADAPNTINNCPNCAPAVVTPLRDSQGNLLDATEVVVNYLQSLPGNLANPVLNRINLLQPLPAPKFGFYEMQPLRGATP